MKTYLLALTVAAWTTLAPAQTNTPAVDPDFAATFEKVVAAVDADELSGMEVAKATYNATKLFATGSRTLPYIQQRFTGAHKESEAAVAGLYTTVYGKEEQLQQVVTELETSAPKRAWLKADVGSEKAFFESVEAGEYWQDFLHLLPSSSGAQKVSRMCMASKDALVRRAGMLWGSFFPDAAYKPALKNIGDSDADPATRRIALRLLQKI